MGRIVVLDGATLNPGDNPWSDMERLGTVQVYQQTAAADVLSRAHGCDILVVNKVSLDASVLDRLESLRMIAVTATGYDCVDVSHARKRGITVANVPVYGTESVAQHVFALILHVIHRVDLHDHAIRNGEWQRCGNFSFWLSPLRELSGKTLGVIGFGRIGRAVARLAVAFGMQVQVHSRSRPSRLPSSVSWASLDDVLASSDFVSLHCPLTEETRGMIDARRLRMFPPHAILVNASRGPLIVEAALADALNENRLTAAMLDVASEEPISPNNPLLSARNCFLTPHMAWATLEARQRLMSVTIENVRQFLNGTPQNVVT